jgi:hypothetical protein
MASYNSCGDSRLRLSGQDNPTESSQLLARNDPGSAQRPAHSRP